MHIVELSNHPGDMLDDATRRRVAAPVPAAGRTDLEHDHAFHDKRGRARSR